MGGHGGLNILPQKRWNVYNRDNREKVERDVRRAQEAEEAKNNQRERAAAETRYDILRMRRAQDDASARRMNEDPLARTMNEYPSSRRAEEDLPSRRERHNSEEPPVRNKLNEELKEAIKEKHFNLFEKEQRINERKSRIEADLEAQREKNTKKRREELEENNRLSGHEIKREPQPWYAVGAAQRETMSGNDKRHRPYKRERDQVDLSLPSDSYYKVLDMRGLRSKIDRDIIIEEVKEEEILPLSRENSAKEKKKKEKKKKKHKKEKKEKKDKKSKKKHKKHKEGGKDSEDEGKERRKSRSSSKSSERYEKEHSSKKEKRRRSRSRSKSKEKRAKEEEKSSAADIEKLRAERLKREAVERQRALELMKKHFPLKEKQPSETGNRH